MCRPALLSRQKQQTASFDKPSNQSPLRLSRVQLAVTVTDDLVTPAVSKALELELAQFHPLVDPLSVSPPAHSETHLSSCRCRSR